MITRRHALLAGISLVLVLLIGTVIYQASRPAGPHTAAVRISGINAIELNLPTLVAIANGYFADEHLNVSSIALADGSTVRTSLIAGETDFALLAFIHTPLARANQKDLKIVLALHDREIFSLLVRSELSHDVREVADLRGRRIGITKPGSGSWAMARLYVQKAGLDPDKDVEIVALGGDLTGLYNALRTGRVDAIPTWEPLTTRLMADGSAYPLIRAWVPAEAERWVGKDALSMTLVVRERMIQTDETLVRRMVKAHQRSLTYISTHSPDDIAALLTADVRTREYVIGDGLDRAQLASVIDRIKTGFGDGSISRRGYATEMELAVRYGLISEAIPFDTSVDSRFAGDRE